MRGASRIAAALVIPAVAWGVPSSAQQKDEMKALIGKAQSDSERRAVEDLISKLQSRARQAAPAPAARQAAPAPAGLANPEGTAPAPVPPAGVPAAPETSPSVIPQSSPADIVPGGVVPGGVTPSAGTKSPQAPSKVVPDKVQDAARAAARAAGGGAVKKATPERPMVKSAAVPVAAPANAASAGKDAALKSSADSISQAPAIAAREALAVIDLEVFFDFASARISPDAMAALVTLGRTLSDPRLADQTFIIAGYTDGKGKPEYNAWLSQLRADTVRLALVNEFKIDPKRLIAKGFGKTKFKNGSNPLANENRRVQIINWTSQLGPGQLGQ